LATYDPNDVGVQNGLVYGLPFARPESELVIVTVPWEVTVSYGTGTASAPTQILEASPQLDLFDPACPTWWHKGLFLEPPHPTWQRESNALRDVAAQVIALREAGTTALDPSLRAMLAQVNAGCELLHQQVEAHCGALLDLGHRVALLGGDHSTPLGLWRALAARHAEGFVLLQIDAHADLRPAYEGFAYSHASITWNGLRELAGLRHVAQVGIRDLSQAEFDVAQQSGRVTLHTDAELQAALLRGQSWASLCTEILDGLATAAQRHGTRKLHISFDIDGLDPALCPSTGTPVPGGLSWAQARHLLQAAADRFELLSFDLVEVGTRTEWDAVVGARLLAELSKCLLR
jgi:agmatinase